MSIFKLFKSASRFYIYIYIHIYIYIKIYLFFFCNFRNTVFNQKSPYQSVSESREGTVNVTDIHRSDGKILLLIEDTENIL